MNIEALGLWKCHTNEFNKVTNTRIGFWGSCYEETDDTEWKHRYAIMDHAMRDEWMFFRQDYDYVEQTWGYFERTSKIPKKLIELAFVHRK